MRRLNFFNLGSGVLGNFFAVINAANLEIRIICGLIYCAF